MKKMHTKSFEAMPLTALTALALTLAGFLTGCGGATQSSPPTPTPSGPTTPDTNTPATPTPTPVPTATPAPAPTDRSYTLGVAGTRGSLPLTMQMGGTSQVIMADPQNGINIPLRSAVISAPAEYGDRKFVKWQWNGQDIAATPVLSLPQATMTGNGALTAVYASRTADADGFTPHYSVPGFPHWDHFPVTVAFDRATVDAATKSRLQKGFDRWVQATGGAVAYSVISDASLADITVTFQSLPANRLGYTIVSWNGANVLTKAEMTFSDQLFTRTGRVNEMETIAAHEFGHAMGLVGTQPNAGHSPDAHDLMYTAPDPARGIVTGQDLDTMTNLYSDRLSVAGRRVNASAATVTTPGKMGVY